MYRPNAIICALAKILKILYSHTFNHVKFTEVKEALVLLLQVCSNEFINELSFVQSVFNAFHNCAYINAIYIHSVKAFDKINHQVLLNKISFFSFSLQLLNLIASYLKQRKQYITYHQRESFSYTVNSGVLQGSNLSPLFFIIYINDLPTTVKYSGCLLYTDDVKLHQEINNEKVSMKLKQDLNMVYKGVWVMILDLIIRSIISSFFTTKHNKIYSRSCILY